MATIKCRRLSDKKRIVRKISLILFLLLVSFLTKAQKVDSIYFHLYTDSLKKGTHNYINVDGKMSDGTWRPLTSKELTFISSDCQFSGNELVLPPDYKGEKITVKVVLKDNPSLWRETTIWVKRKPDPDRLPSSREIMKER